MNYRYWLGPLLLVALAFLATMHVPADQPARDGFHEGEYLSAWVLPFAAEHGVLPRLIHGGMDHIPARVVAAACDPSRQIVCIRWANAGLTFVASALFLLAAWLMLLPLRLGARIIALIPAVSLILLVNGSATHPLELQQGAPAVRDIVVLGVVLVLLAWCRRQGGYAPAQAWHSAGLLAVAGTIAGLGWFWAYNRGTVALIAVVAMAAAQLFLRRSPRGLVAAGAGIALGLLIVAVSGIYGSVDANLDNLAYWSRHRDLYAVEWDLLVWLPVVPGLLLLAATFAVALVQAWVGLRQARTEDALLIGLLSLVTLMYAAQTVARPDRPHLAWALWPTMLLIVALLSVVLRPPVTTSRTVIAFTIAVAVMVANSYGHGGPGNIATAMARSLAAPWHLANTISAEDEELVEPGLRDAAAAIRAEAPACTMAMSNEGLLYLLAATPPCSRFAFPVHIGRDHQQEVIGELRREAPPTLLFDSPFWGSRIDGLALADRTPELAVWILEAYPHETVLAQGYRLRHRRRPMERP